MQRRRILVVVAGFFAEGRGGVGREPPRLRWGRAGRWERLQLWEAGISGRMRVRDLGNRSHFPWRCNPLRFWEGGLRLVMMREGWGRERRFWGGIIS